MHPSNGGFKSCDPPKPFVLLSMFSMYLNINVLNLMLVLISLPEALVLQEELSKVR